MRRRFATATAVLAGSGLLLGATAPASSASASMSTTGLFGSNCPGVSVSRSTFLPGGLPLVNWRENLAFDGRGRMWVSNNTGNRVEAYNPAGTRVTSFPVNGPGGLALAPTGRMEVNTGIVFGSSGTISSFDPTAATPVLRTEVANVSGHNGLAVDSQGNRYVTGEGADTVRRYLADGSYDAGWSAAAKVSGTNGAWVAGQTLYVSRLSDLTSTVVALGLKAPAPRNIVSLSPFGLGWKGLDDLTVVGQYLYVAGFASGDITRISLADGGSCTLASGLVMPTSVRAPIAFGSADPNRDLFVTGADGAITRFTVTQR